MWPPSTKSIWRLLVEASGCPGEQLGRPGCWGGVLLKKGGSSTGKTGQQPWRTLLLSYKAEAATSKSCPE